MRRLYTHFEEITACAMLAALCLIVALQVLARYLLAHPLSWTEELSTILFVWITMIGASLALKNGEHFAVELLHPRLGPRARLTLRSFVLAVLVACSLLLLVKGGEFAWRNRLSLTPTLELPRAVPYAAIPFGGALMLVRSLAMLAATIRRGVNAP